MNKRIVYEIKNQSLKKNVLTSAHKVNTFNQTPKSSIANVEIS